MKTVKYEVEYEEHAGRLELIIRIIWLIPSAIVLMILGIISSIAWLLQLLCILILGKRNGFLHEWILKYYAYLIKLQSYEGYLTDERNPIIPES